MTCRVWTTTPEVSPGDPARLETLRRTALLDNTSDAREPASRFGLIRGRCGREIRRVAVLVWLPVAANDFPTPDLDRAVERSWYGHYARLWPFRTPATTQDETKREVG